MILKSLRLKNIRSYIDEKVEFPKGISVFTGDIGCGKSTLLYAVEFALFGATSDLPLEYLLRHGEARGSVELTFEIEGKVYTVHREIEQKDGKYNSSKKDNWLKVKEAIVHYTPQELKEQMLKTVLQFNESLAPRASSVIYRFALFTPQEEMKRILEQNIEDRLVTLRKAFRLEDYKTAQDNVKIVQDFLRDERRTLEGKASDLKEKETALVAKRTERTDKEERLRVLLKKMDKWVKVYEEKKKCKEDLEKLEREKLNLEKYQESTLRDVENLRSNLKRAREELQQVEEAEGQMAKLEPKLKELDQVKEERERLDEQRRQYEEKSKVVLGLEKDEEALEARIKELDDILAKAPELKERVKVLDKEVARADKATEKVKENREDVARLEAQMKITKDDWGKKYVERDSYKELEGKAKCPKCGQDLSTEHLKKVLDDLDIELKALDRSEKENKKDIAKAQENIQKFTLETKNLEKDRTELAQAQGELTRLDTEGARMKELKQTLNHNEVDLKAAQNTLKKMAVNETQYDSLKKKEKDLEELAKRYVIARAKVEGAERWRGIAMKTETDLSQKEEKLGSIGKELEALFEKYDDVGLENAKKEYEEAREIASKGQTEAESMKAVMERIDEEIVTVKAEIDKKREFQVKAQEHQRAEDWMRDCFSGALDIIEKHVLASINEEFEQLFQKWFNMLIESPEINVRIDDNFTPLIEQSGYELDHKALSGGERTSVALAYRLALNAMVKKTSVTMKENLLILDEPTDGFSMEQLVRVRDVLEELRSDQCIIVTHERELEGFADKVFKVVKEGGVSRIAL
jgi:DNA repair protein SbcC/Rad50